MCAWHARACHALVEACSGWRVCNCKNLPPCSVKVEREGAFGEGITADDLVPGGGEVPVAPSNRAHFVELYTRHLLEGSIARQFSAFRRGFEQACSPLTPYECNISMDDEQH